MNCSDLGNSVYVDVSHPLNVWISYAVYQEYVQYILKMVLLDQHTESPMALLLPWISIGLLDMERR